MTREVMQQAFDLIERLNKHGWILADFETEVYAAIAALRTALEQQAKPVASIYVTIGGYREFDDWKHDLPVGCNLLYTATPLPVQEPDLTTDRSLYLDLLHQLGVTGHEGAKAEIANLRAAAGLTATPPLPVQEPVSMRMPKVGDKVICLEDESFGKVVSLTAGGSPDILFDDGSHGTYLLREFAELFGYVNSPQQQAEPVAWDKPSTNFNEWWDSDRRRDNANPFTTDSLAYWAWEGWQAAQRQWVGLTYEEIDAIGDKVANEQLVGPVANFRVRLARAIEQTLKELNK